VTLHDLPAPIVNEDVVNRSQLTKAIIKIEHDLDEVRASLGSQVEE
jgi:hypothetical protein